MKKFVKSNIMKALVLEAWEDLRVARRGIIARSTIRMILERYKGEEQVLLLEKIGTVGFYLKELSQAGYGYNSSSKVIKDDDGKIAGELCKENSDAVWIYDNIGVK